MPDRRNEMFPRENQQQSDRRRKQSKRPAADVSLELDTKKSLNVSAGRIIYEKAASRRSRHRAVLQAHAARYAVALKPASTTRRTILVPNDEDEEDPYAAAIMRKRELEKLQQERRMTKKNMLVARRRSAAKKSKSDSGVPKYRKGQVRVAEACGRTKLGNTTEDAIEIDL